MKRAAFALSALLLASCGTRGPLVPLKSYDDVTPQQLRELRRDQRAAQAKSLTPPPEAAPRRKDNADEGMLPRADDPFDPPMPRRQQAAPPPAEAATPPQR